MKRRKGFTLIELLVVIAIIATLLSIIMPAIRAVKQQATGAVCQSNLRGLSTSWLVYGQDNNNFMVEANTEYVGLLNPPINGYTVAYDWVCFSQDEDGALDMSSLENRIRGIQKGLLYSYSNSPDIYHCPGDKRKDGAFRSYSIQGYMNGGRYNPLPSRDIMVKKISEIRNPLSKVVFVEEQGAEFNWNNWALLLEDYRWTDPLAIWHNKQSTLGFADGHAEVHRWVDVRTIEMAEKQEHWYYAAESEDLLYMQRAVKPK